MNRVAKKPYARTNFYTRLTAQELDDSIGMVDRPYTDFHQCIFPQKKDGTAQWLPYENVESLLNSIDFSAWEERFKEKFDAKKSYESGLNSLTTYFPHANPSNVTERQHDAKVYVAQPGKI